MIEVIEQYNQDPLFHGILVQLPLPNHINEMRILLAIDPKKDVDGFHPMNTGNLWEWSSSNGTLYTGWDYGNPS